MCVYRKVKEELPVSLKTKTLSCILKKKLKLCICVWTSLTWLRALESTLFLKKMFPATLERQLNYLKCFVTMPRWQSSNLDMKLCHQSFLLHCLSLTCWKLLPFLENIWFFSYNFKNTEPLIIFIALIESPSINWRECPWQYLNWTQSRFCTLLLQF